MTLCDRIWRSNLRHHRTHIRELRFATLHVLRIIYCGTSSDSIPMEKETSSVRMDLTNLESGAPMTKQLITPKYLTKEVAQQAVSVALHSVIDDGAPLHSYLKRHHCHVVVLVPAMEDARQADYPDWPNYPLQPVLIYEQSGGDKGVWEHEYDNIARCKALQLWTDRNDDRTDAKPHLLFPGDTPYWGGVKRHGIVVCCSGVQPWFNKLISGISADTIVALSYDAYKNDPELAQGADFLS